MRNEGASSGLFSMYVAISNENININRVIINPVINANPFVKQNILGIFFSVACNKFRNILGSSDTHTCRSYSYKQIYSRPYKTKLSIFFLTKNMCAYYT